MDFRDSMKQFNGVMEAARTIPAGKPFTTSSILTESDNGGKGAVKHFKTPALSEDDKSKIKHKVKKLFESIDPSTDVSAPAIDYKLHEAVSAVVNLSADELAGTPASYLTECINEKRTQAFDWIRAVITEGVSEEGSNFSEAGSTSVEAAGSVKTEAAKKVEEEDEEAKKIKEEEEAAKKIEEDAAKGEKPGEKPEEKSEKDPFSGIPEVNPDSVTIVSTDDQDTEEKPAEKTGDEDGDIVERLEDLEDVVGKIASIIEKLVPLEEEEHKLDIDGNGKVNGEPGSADLGSAADLLVHKKHLLADGDGNIEECYLEEGANPSSLRKKASAKSLEPKKHFERNEDGALEECYLEEDADGRQVVKQPSGKSFIKHKNGVLEECYLEEASGNKHDIATEAEDKAALATEIAKAAANGKKAGDADFDDLLAKFRAASVVAEGEDIPALVGRAVANAIAKGTDPSQIDVAKVTSDVKNIIAEAEALYGIPATTVKLATKPAHITGEAQKTVKPVGGDLTSEATKKLEDGSVGHGLPKLGRSGGLAAKNNEGAHGQITPIKPAASPRATPSKALDLPQAYVLLEAVKEKIALSKAKAKKTKEEAEAKKVEEEAAIKAAKK